MSTAFHRREPGFCLDCGSVLPLLAEGSRTGKCYTCKKVFGAEVFASTESHYVVQFNSGSQKHGVKKNEGEDEGPIVERKCPKCDNEKMSYATLQLRSADEGQTVFYTCTKCKHKETENS